jgi:outer membrane protein OmpA-like peptidoglycan-associated protein
VLTPDDPDVLALTRTIQAQIDNPTREDIVRGLRDSWYRPLVVASVSGLSGSAAVSAPPAAAPPGGPSVNIPINFITGSTRVDEETRSNIIVLAQALADSEFHGHRFLFIGHADVRGDSIRNLDLSRQRAEALSQAVIMLEPSLDGRIDVTGKGAADPIDPANHERAWRANRRLQVVLR